MNPKALRMKFTLRTIVLTLAALFALAGTSAFAASPNTIINDAKDGSIDGDYTLSDLRAADAAISPEVREYNLWDEVYAVAIARAGNKNAPKPKVVKPTDRDGDGAIEPEERAEAAKETRELNKKIIKVQPKPTKSTSAMDASDEVDEVDTVAADSTSNKDDDGGASWPLIILVAAIIVIGLVGVWRVIATRKKPGDGDSTDMKRGPREPRDGGPNAGPGPRR